MQYIAYGASPVCLTLLVFLLTGFWRKVKIRTIIFLLIIPAVTAALVWFDPKFDLVCYNFSLIRYHGNAFIHKSYGPWFYVHLVYSYSLMLYSAGMLVVKIIREKQIYKNQSFFLWISILLVFVPNILFVRGIRPGGNFDVTPFFFSMAGIIVFLDIFRYRFLDLIPVARGIIFENIHDGIIVADSGYRIIDMNKRAEELFRISGDTLHGYAAGTASVPVC
jgi:PAS domain-containing protein